MGRKLFLIGLLALVGCSDNNSGSAQLDGTYQVVCSRNDDGNFVNAQLKFSGNTVTYKDEDFGPGGAGCPGAPGRTSTTDLSYVIGKDATAPAGTKEADFTEKATGKVVYSIIKIDGNKITVGTETAGHEGRTQATRHNQLSVLVFTKQ